MLPVGSTTGTAERTVTRTAARALQRTVARSATKTWSVAILAFSAIACVSWIAQAVTNDRRTFSTVSNLAYGTNAVLVPVVSHNYLVDAHPMVYATTIVSALLASGSFAFHLARGNAEPSTITPVHTLDLAMAWVLYVHLALLAVYTLAQRFVAWNRLLLFLTMIESLVILLVFTFYDYARRYQVYLLVVCGGVLFACTLVSRLHAGVSTRDAVLDTAILVGMQAVATILQGELWYSALSDSRYNIEHGYWHMLNATIVNVTVVQTARLLSNVADDVLSVESSIVSRVAFVVFGLSLAASTILNTDDEPMTALLVVLQVALLLVTCRCLWVS